MRKSIKSLKSGFAGVLCASIAAIALPSEGSAGPVSVAAPDLVGLTQQVEQVHYRRGPRLSRAYYPRRHYPVDVNALLAGGLAVAGAAVASHPYNYGYGGYGYPYYGYGYGGYPAYYGGWGW